MMKDVKKPEQSKSCSVEMVNVKALVSDAESKSNTAKKGHPKKTTKQRRQCQLFLRFLRSRYMGLVVGPLYGVFVYYYVTYLILDGPPFMVEKAGNLTVTDDVNVTLVGDLYGSKYKTDGAVDEEDLVDRRLGQYIGGSIGAGCAISLTVGSLVSPKTRCAMMLIIPSLAARRGRAFLLTSAAGMVLSGPVNTIDYNIQQVVKSLTCMYEQMKSLADMYLEQFRMIWDAVQQILEQMNRMVERYQEQLAELAEDATADVRRQIDQAQEEVRQQAEDLKDKLSTLGDVLDAPGNAAGWLCDEGASVLAVGEDAGNAVADTFNKGWKDVKNFFGRRKKRDTCGVAPVVPEVNLGLPNPNLDSLKDFLGKLKPDIDLVDFDLEHVLGELQYNSIHEIRERLKNILKSVFEVIKKYSVYLTKLFYLSIILVVIDALRYMKRYYSDDSFDNMMVDDNLRQLWKTGDKEKILPLRRWELRVRYQYSKSYKVSKAEVKRIIIELIPTLLFIIITALIMAGDYGLSSILTLFRDEAKFGVSFEGSEQGVNFNSLLGGLETGTIDVASIKLEGFNLTTEPCLPRPAYTDLNVIVRLTSLMLVALLLGITDAYGSRTRAMICNLYFKTRAKERAEYLYKRIQTGRRTRRIQLSMIVSRELGRRYRADRFVCPCLKSVCCKQCDRGSHGRYCPACCYKMRKDDDAAFSLTREGTKEDIPICNDCHKDVQ